MYKYVKKLISAFIACVLTAVFFTGCGKIFKKEQPGPAPEYAAFHRDIKDVNFSDITFTPWDVAKASAKVQARQKKPYTVMVYMNGSDLESEGGAATKDLLEMLNSGLLQKNANLVIFTGGTNRWQNNTVPANSCCVWEILDGKLHKIADVGLLNMGNPGTLSCFIDFGLTNFPAEKSGIIFWDHGGGSIAGFGHDEKFKNGTLTLLDMNYAFEKSMLTEQPLEFLGFDSCLMASAEMAVVASDYARFLIASEDLEPGDGWDYRFLSVLNNGAGLDGMALGKAVTDYFIKFYGPSPDADLALSVTDLSAAKNLMEAMGKLMNLCSADLAAKPSAAFKTLAQKRSRTKTFGIGSPRDNESDMVDLAETARSLTDAYPAEAGAVLAALGQAVVYNRHNSGLALGGLSAFYIYGGKRTANESLDVYSSLKMDQNYTAYLYGFYRLLSGNSLTFSRNRMGQAGDITLSELTMWEPDVSKGCSVLRGIKESGDKDPLWPEINGQNVCFYKISGSQGKRLYAVPMSVNGRDADLIVAVSPEHSRGRVLGARKEDGFIIQKGYDEIRDGDKISFYYRTRPLNGESSGGQGWQKGSEFTVKGALELTWAAKKDGGAFYSLRYKDYMQNEFYGKMTTSRYESAA